MTEAEIFEKRWNAAPDWQCERYSNLMKNYDTIPFNQTQKRYILWLCSFDNETTDTFESIFELLEHQP